MRAEDIRELLKKQPFTPFRVCMTDGKTYEIMHPELVFLTKSYLHVTTIQDPTTGIPDRVEYAALIHIVRVEELRREATTPNN